MIKKRSIVSCKAIFIYSILLLGISTLYGQKEPQYTQYMYNIGSFNSAYVGTTETPEISLLYRAQWIDIPGAPRTIRAGLNLPLANEKNGLGFNIINDELGPATHTYIDAAYSFQVLLSENTKLSFGVNAGGSLLNMDFNKGSFEFENEPLLNSQSLSKFYPTVGAGTFMYSDDWYLGISVPNFITDVAYSDEIKTVLEDKIQFNFIGGYVFNISDGFKFKPAFLINYLKGAPTNINISSNFLISNVVTLGASYKLDTSISALAGIQISNSLFFGYSYDYNTNGLGDFNSGSHEAILKFYIGRKGSVRNSNNNSKSTKGQPKQIDTPRFF